MGFNARATARALLGAALEESVAAGELPAGARPSATGDIPVERPKRPGHGDFASNLALALAKPAGKPPRAVADSLVKRLRARAGGDLADASVAGPGFINLRLSDATWRQVLPDILTARSGFGRGPPREHPKVLIEFLSANPTGPMTVAHGRHAAVGDALARLMRFAGYPVTTEFYVNDAGNQIRLLALSVWTRYLEAARAVDASVPEAALPENGYQGDYIRDFGRALLARDGRRWVAAAPPADLGPLEEFAVDRSLAMIRASLAAFDVSFDVWQSERDLHASGAVTETIEVLARAGHTFAEDGAVWLRTTALAGDDKDRVLRKSDGSAAYFLADIAYHRKKLGRGFDQICNILGADHHGHLPRMRAAFVALGADPDALRVVLIQTVRLLRGGQEVKMGKRSGEFVTLDEVVEEVGRDATRFYYLMRRHDTPVDFDLDLAKKQSMDNPVYYAQYAHARCSAILRRADELGAPRMPLSPGLAERLALPEEIAILRRLADFGPWVEDAAAAREPHRLCAYLHDLAGEFQSYYTRLQKVHGDTILPQERHRQGDWRASWDWQKTAARLLWVEAIREVIRNALGLLGVRAPDAMARPLGAGSEIEDEVR